MSQRISDKEICRRKNGNFATVKLMKNLKDASNVNIAMCGLRASEL
jgi:hypothetical protein